MPYKRGDVVLVLFPDSNLLTANRRPALVIQADNLNTGLNQMDSVVMTDNLATVLDSEIDRALGTWADMAAVNAALKHTLGLP